MGRARTATGRRYRQQGKAWRRGRRSRLPLALIAGAVLLLGSSLWLALGAGRSQSGVPIEVSGSARLRLDQQKVDLGLVRLGQVAAVEFQLANVGDQTLRFTQMPYIEVVEGC
jgi:hypothetical protein